MLWAECGHQLVDSALRQYTLRVGMFHFAHLGYQVGDFPRFWHVRCAPYRLREHVSGRFFKDSATASGSSMRLADGVVDFVQNHQIIIFPL